jgi:hypothetical protein
MLKHKYNISWTPGTCVDQVVEVAEGNSTFIVFGNGLPTTTTEFPISIPDGVKSIAVRVGSRAPGQLPVYSEEVIIDLPVTPPPTPITLTAPTNVSALYLGTEDVP